MFSKNYFLVLFSRRRGPSWGFSRRRRITNCELSECFCSFCAVGFFCLFVFVLFCFLLFLFCFCCPSRPIDRFACPDLLGGCGGGGLSPAFSLVNCAQKHELVLFFRRAAESRAACVSHPALVIGLDRPPPSLLKSPAHLPTSVNQIILMHWLLDAAPTLTSALVQNFVGFNVRLKTFACNRLSAQYLNLPNAFLDSFLSNKAGFGSRPPPPIFCLSFPALSCRSQSENGGPL